MSGSYSFLFRRDVCSVFAQKCLDTSEGLLVRNMEKRTGITKCIFQICQL